MGPLGPVSAVLPALLWWPTGGAQPRSELRAQGVRLQTWLREQRAGALSPQDRQGSGFWITRLRPS